MGSTRTFPKVKTFEVDQDNLCKKYLAKKENIESFSVKYVKIHLKLIFIY